VAGFSGAGIASASAFAPESNSMNRCNPPPRRLRPVIAITVVVCLALPALAAEPDRSEAFTASDIRDLRRGSEKSGASDLWFGSVGAAYIRAEDGARVWLTPVSLDYQLNRDTTLTLESDGYGRIASDGTTTSGFNNLTLIASRVVYRDDASRLRLAIGATAPGSSGIGSRGSKQRISASYSRTLSEHWALGLSAKLTRRNQELRAGESRFEQSGRVQTTYTFDERQPAGLLPPALVFQLEREHRRGAGGLTEATAKVEFPLSRKLGASLGFSRGLTAGLRDNTFAFDLLFSF
jgi:hypothetical protein